MSLEYYEKTKPNNSKKINKLLDIIKYKKSNLIISIDKTNKNDIIDIIHKTAKHIIAIKLHIDIITDFSPDFIDVLLEYKEKYKFLIIEDRKLVDIGNTLKMQITSYTQIYKWADFITALPCIGITGVNILNKYNIQPILIENLSTYKKYPDNPYVPNALPYYYSFNAKKLIDDNKNCLICGIISQTNVKSDKQNIWQFTPGISITDKGDNFNQKYRTPYNASKLGAQFFIVGRGIINSNDPEKYAELYKNECLRFLEKK